MDYFGSFGQSKSEALHRLEPIVEAALEAHQFGRYDEYMKLVTASLSEKVTERGFLKAYHEAQTGLGELVGKSFLGSLNKNGNPMLIYSAQYRETTDDVLVTIVFKNETQPPEIDWLWIQ